MSKAVIFKPGEVGHSGGNVYGDRHKAEQKTKKRRKRRKVSVDPEKARYEFRAPNEYKRSKNICPSEWVRIVGVTRTS